MIDKVATSNFLSAPVSLIPKTNLFGTWLVTNNSVWDLEAKKKHFDVPTTTYAITTKDDNKLILGHDDGHVTVWDINNGNIIKEIYCHHKKITQLSITKGEDYLLSASTDSTVRVFDFKTGQLVSILPCYTNNIMVNQINDRNEFACCLGQINHDNEFAGSLGGDDLLLLKLKIP